MSNAHTLFLTISSKVHIIKRWRSKKLRESEEMEKGEFMIRGGGSFGLWPILKNVGFVKFLLIPHYLIKKNTARNDLPCASYIRHRFFQHQNHDPITLNHVINMCHTELGWPLCIFMLPKENYKSFNVLPQKPNSPSKQNLKSWQTTWC